MCRPDGIKHRQHDHEIRMTPGSERCPLLLLRLEREAAEEHWGLMETEGIVATLKDNTIKVGQGGGWLLLMSLIQYLKHIFQEVCEDCKLCGGLLCFFLT